MTLAPRLYSKLSYEMKTKAQHYYLNDFVTIHSQTPEAISATVEGTDPYEVSLTFEDDEARAFCSCPYFSKYSAICKHIGAVLLAVGDTEVKAELNATPLSVRNKITPPAFQRKPEVLPSWKAYLSQVKSRSSHEEARHRNPSLKPDEEIVYVVDLGQTLQSKSLIVEPLKRQKKKDGGFGQVRRLSISRDQIPLLVKEEDRKIFGIMAGALPDLYYGGYYSRDNFNGAVRIPPPLFRTLLPLLCGTQRCLMRMTKDPDSLVPLSCDSPEPYKLKLQIFRSKTNGKLLLDGEFKRGENGIDVVVTEFVLDGGLALAEGEFFFFEDAGSLKWVEMLRDQEIEIPDEDLKKFCEEYFSLQGTPAIALPPEFELQEELLSPRPTIRFKKKPNRSEWEPPPLEAWVSFDYDGTLVPSHDKRDRFFQKVRHRLVLRDKIKENEAFSLLAELGLKLPFQNADRFEISFKKFSKAADALIQQGWQVEADGILYRRYSRFKLQVSTGINWFDISADTEFEGTKVPFPAILNAIKRGEKTVVLGDGSMGILPEEWLKQFALLAEMGESSEETLRVSKAQAGILDALLSLQPEATWDEPFEKIRGQLKSFSGIKPALPKKAFTGQLRPYQQEGLGWLHFLRDFGFGGCLADDMGLGKTIQILSLLASRKNAEKPSLVVVPKSVVFNWKSEISKFTPTLRVLDHTGIDRPRDADSFGKYHVMLTTYGILRRDIHFLKDFEFDYVILDESQAIKNAMTDSAKAVRLLQGAHRLALTGTPIENHLGELWSLLEFLNPGMLGSVTLFKKYIDINVRNPEDEASNFLAKALKPFILRRTKAEVAKELPERTEQTLFCQLEGTQRDLYDELKNHFRSQLLSKVDEKGIEKSKMHILEALLRLRQAACHPGLLDSSRSMEPSAKLDALFPLLNEVLEEGHKALIFSQFTSFLAIVKNKLHRQSIRFAYLDGQTRNRAECVETFQNDPKCKVFLISLKAGGVGLNLTTADYVFLLDPWWNPAVEAQAIDRTHRIGQTKNVFAYRLIAKDTIEEKVLALQQNKRALAEALFSAKKSLLSGLTREDLQLLLS